MVWIQSWMWSTHLLPLLPNQLWPGVGVHIRVPPMGDISKVSKVISPLVEDEQKAPFSIVHWGVGEGATPFPGLLHFTLDPYLILLSVKQGDIKYHFKSLWYDATWDWTQVSRTIGKHSTQELFNHLLHLKLFNCVQTNDWY